MGQKRVFCKLLLSFEHPTPRLILLTKLEKALRRQRKKERERSKKGGKKRDRKGEKEKGREVCDYFFWASSILSLARLPEL